MRTFPAAARLLLMAGLLALAGCAGSSPDSPASLSQPGQEASRPAEALVVRSDRPRQQAPPGAPEDLRALADSNAAFAFDLYRKLLFQDDNLLFSPYSISLALGMTFAGAAGETASQMAETMHFSLPPDRLHSAFNAQAQLLEALAEAPGEGTPFELSLANSLWGQQDLRLEPAFLDLLAQDYGAGLRLVDFAADPEAARLAINQWVSNETNDKIQDLIPSGVLNSLTRLVLANAIYFKAAWLYPFEESSTSAEPFHLLDGSTVDAPMMNQSESLEYALMDDYGAVQLPYQGANISMLLILPDDGRFEAVEAALDSAGIEEILPSLRHAQVKLTLPKFSYESSFNLNQALESQGMIDAFDVDRADFSLMTGAPDLYIGHVLHKALIDVNEAGTEAAAATAVIMQLKAAPMESVEFRVDRPFIYLIRDEQTGSILFLGRVLNPAQ